MGDRQCPEFNYGLMRAVAGFVIMTPGILLDAFVSPFVWIVRGIWTTAGTYLLYFGAVSLFVMAYRALDLDRRIQLYYRAAQIMALQAICDALTPRPPPPRPEE